MRTYFFEMRLTKYPRSVATLLEIHEVVCNQSKSNSICFKNVMSVGNFV